MRDWFDIDIGDGVDEADWRFAARMFQRRHVYEHNGGEVDQRYLDDSGDTTVRLKQRIHETRQDVHTLLGTLVRIVLYLHRGFHELIPPRPERIKMFEERKAQRLRRAVAPERA